MKTATQERAIPEVNERVLAILDPSMLPEAELPTTPLTSFWYRANWEPIEVAIAQGRVVVLSVESGELHAAATAALFYTGGNLAFRHDAARARLYLYRPPRAAEESTDDETADGQADTDGAADMLSMRLSNAALIGIEGTIAMLSLEQLFRTVEALATKVAPDKLPEIEAHDGDREWLGGALVDCLGRLSVPCALAVRKMLNDKAANGGDDDGEFSLAD